MTGKHPRPTEELFEDISQFVAESRALLEKGAMMELAGLDGAVRRLCDEVLQLTQEERERYADKLQQLLADLTDLGVALVEQRDRIGGEIQGLAQHKKASVAYRTSDAIDDFGDKDDKEEE